MRTFFIKEKKSREMINWPRHGGVSTNILAGCCLTLQLPAMGMSVPLVGCVGGGWELVRWQGGGGAG